MLPTHPHPVFADQKFNHTIEGRFWNRVLIVPYDRGCWLWTASNGGYGKLSKGKKEDGAIDAHRFSWILHRGRIPTGLCVLHSCDNRACVNPAHLFLGTLADNNRDCAEKGRTLRGETNNQAKLTQEQALEILNAGPETSHAALGRKFGVTKEAVGAIRNRVNWKHLDELDRKGR